MKTNELIEMTKQKNNINPFTRMKRLLECVSSDPTRAVLQRVKVEKEGEQTRITATDGRRLRSDLFDLQAAEGVYDIRANTATQVLLTKNKERLRFPNWRQVLPREEKAWALKGCGKNFVLWAGSSLGCRIDPKLVSVTENEEITLFIQREEPALNPVMLKNDTTIHIIMPVRVDEPWVAELDRIRKKAA